MTTHYIWDVVNDSYLMETDGDGNVTAEYTTEPVPYGRVISQRRGNATSFYHYDGQGSTRQLTDESGNVTDEYTSRRLARRSRARARRKIRSDIMGRLDTTSIRNHVLYTSAQGTIKELWDAGYQRIPSA